MAQRIAHIGLLNKRNRLVHMMTMKPGEAKRVERTIIRLRACEQTAPWESPPETGAFVQLSVKDQHEDKWNRVFSGWLFHERPERNVIEHPVYDVFVKSCTMSFPSDLSANSPPANLPPSEPVTGIAGEPARSE